MSDDSSATGVVLHGAVLVVDDEALVRGTSVRTLRRLGFETLEADGGVAALKLLTANPGAIACVVLDVAMPGMNGQETFRALRRVRSDVPIVVASGHAMNPEMAALVATGAAAFIAKPFGRADLIAAIKRAVG